MTTRQTCQRHARKIACGVFHTDDARQFCQLAHRFRCHVHNGTTRDVVNEDRDIRAVVNSRVVRHQAALRRLVVIRRDDKNRIRADLFGALRKADGFEGVVATSARNHRKPTR